MHSSPPSLSIHTSASPSSSIHTSAPPPSSIHTSARPSSSIYTSAPPPSSSSSSSSAAAFLLSKEPPPHSSSSQKSSSSMQSTSSQSNASSASSNSFAAEEMIDQDNSDSCAFQHKVYCHVFDQCVQNAKTIISILRHIFLCLKKTVPEIKYVHLRSDNAGCYHGSEALLSVEQLFKETGIWIKSINFSDPQSGKGPCDRMAAVIKCTIRRFINEKHDCTNAFEFIKAAGNFRSDF